MLLHQSANPAATRIPHAVVTRQVRTMASLIPIHEKESFQEHLRKSRRILALLGAGLSASSGLPTFRGAGGLWRDHDAVSLATPEAFDREPGLVWQFYGYRRHMALKARPNKAHYALAELARRKPDFLTLSQNVDGKIVASSKWQLSHIVLISAVHSQLSCWTRKTVSLISKVLPNPPSR